MATKRAREYDASNPRPKRLKKGFSVGPANLPDGTYRRKVQKIKKNLIEGAKVKRSYAKLKERQPAQPPSYRYDDDKDQGHQPADEAESEWGGVDEGGGEQPASLELHPSRQQMLESKDEPVTDDRDHKPPAQRRDGHQGDAARLTGGRERRKHKQRPIPFARESREAQRRREDAERRAKEREENRLQRERKLEERDRFRRAMAKARTGGKNGQRKLGREGQVLLEKVRRAVGT